MQQIQTNSLHERFLWDMFGNTSYQYKEHFKSLIIFVYKKNTSNMLEIFKIDDTGILNLI